MNVAGKEARPTWVGLVSNQTTKAIMDIKQLSTELYSLADTATDEASREYLQEVACVLLFASTSGGVDQIGRQAKQQQLCKALEAACQPH